MSYSSLTGFERPLRVELDASRRLALAGAAVHVLAVAACLMAALDPWLRLLLAAAAAAHYGYFLRRQASARTGRALKAVSWDKLRGWRVCCGDGVWQSAQLRLPVYVSAAVVIMRFRAGTGKSCSAVVVADRLCVDDFRRLRVRLLQSVRAKRN
jgi:Membrane-bound toxin component of toxin-antitoxin system